MSGHSPVGSKSCYNQLSSKPERSLRLRRIKELAADRECGVCEERFVYVGARKSSHCVASYVCFGISTACLTVRLFTINGST